jgi:hypothetical protein
MPGLSKFVVLITAATVGCAVAFAQTSSAMVKADPSRQYEAVRKTMQSFYERGLLSSYIGLHSSHTYDLYSCMEPAEFAGESHYPDYKDKSWDLSYLITLAATTVLWRNDFLRLGVPPQVSEPLVSRYEEVALKQGGRLSDTQDETGKKQLATALNSYRRQSEPSLPRFVVQGGCGGGEIEVRLVLRPPDGRLFLIPVFLYKLCQVQHLDPVDARSCDRWTEVVNGAVSYVSGDYIYMARWTDGAVRCGPLGFKSPQQEGKTFAITKVRSPECNPGW